MKSVESETYVEGDEWLKVSILLLNHISLT
ncbi:hypothetical protein VRRI112168_16665 [Vreelandella rituensis]